MLLLRTAGERDSWLNALHDAIDQNIQKRYSFDLRTGKIKSAVQRARHLQQLSRRTAIYFVMCPFKRQINNCIVYLVILAALDL